MIGRRRWTVLGAVALVAAAVLAVSVEPSLAQSSLTDGQGSQVGKNVGDEVSTWAKSIIFAVIGLVAVPILFKRDVGGGVTVALLGLVLGGFVFAGDSMKSLIDALWGFVSGGGASASGGR